MRVGDAELRDQVFAVVPIRAGFGIAGSAPVDGLIGFEVLARYVTVFDYANRRVTLRMPGTGTTLGRTVPFVFRSSQPQLACALDGIAGVCSVDTGSRSSISVLTPFVAAHPTIVPADATAPGVDGFGIGGAAVGRLGRLASLELGGFEMKNLVADFSSQKAGFFASPDVAANVGGGVWKRFTVTFDYAHQTMALEPNPSFGARDDQERAGVFVINKGGQFVVVDVRAGTPAAAAGLVKGDVVVSMEGAPAEQLTLGKIREAFQGPSGTVVHLGIARAGARTALAVTLTLRDYV